MNNVEAVRATLHDAMESDDRTIILGEDVGARGNVFLITKDFLEEFGPERVIDTPIAEASIVGIAVGMAMEGLRPIAEIQFADFIYPAFNQIVGEAAKTRYRSNGEYTCPLVIRTPYGGGVRGALSHSVSIEALFYHVPGLKIVAPSSPADIKGLLNAAIDDPDPVLFLEHKKTYRLIKGEVPDGHYTIPIGKADVLKEGTQLTVVSYGCTCTGRSTRRSSCEQEGLSVEVIDLRSIRPMDKTTILASVEKTRKLLIIHEDNKFGGIGAEISAMVAEEALFDLDAPIRRLCGARRSRDGLRPAAGRRVHVVAGEDGRGDARNGEVLMATTITMPQLGETVTEGTVAQWLKKRRRHASRSTKPFVEVSTDKVNAEVPSPVTGIDSRDARQGRRDRSDRHRRSRSSTKSARRPERSAEPRRQPRRAIALAERTSRRDARPRDQRPREDSANRRRCRRPAAARPRTRCAAARRPCAGWRANTRRHSRG